MLCIALANFASDAFAQERPASVTVSLQDAPSGRTETIALKVDAHLHAIRSNMATLKQIVKDVFDEALAKKKAVKNLRNRQPDIEADIATISATERDLKKQHARFNDQISKLLGECEKQGTQMTLEKKRIMQAIKNAEADQVIIETKEFPSIEKELKESEREQK